MDIASLFSEGPSTGTEHAARSSSTLAPRAEGTFGKEPGPRWPSENHDRAALHGSSSGAEDESSRRGREARPLRGGAPSGVAPDAPIAARSTERRVDGARRAATSATRPRDASPRGPRCLDSSAGWRGSPLYPRGPGQWTSTLGHSSPSLSEAQAIDTSELVGHCQLPLRTGPLPRTEPHPPSSCSPACAAVLTRTASQLSLGHLGVPSSSGFATSSWCEGVRESESSRVRESQTTRV